MRKAEVAETRVAVAQWCGTRMVRKPQGVDFQMSDNPRCILLACLRNLFYSFDILLLTTGVNRVMNCLTQFVIIFPEILWHSRLSIRFSVVSGINSQVNGH